MIFQDVVFSPSLLGALCTTLMKCHGDYGFWTVTFLKIVTGGMQVCAVCEQFWSFRVYFHKKILTCYDYASFSWGLMM